MRHARCQTSPPYRHFDCAPIYGNEAEIGEMAFSGLAPGEREHMWVTSKLWTTEMRGDDVRHCRGGVEARGRAIEWLLRCRGRHAHVYSLIPFNSILVDFRFEIG